MMSLSGSVLLIIMILNCLNKNSPIFLEGKPFKFIEVAKYIHDGPRGMALMDQRGRTYNVNKKDKINPDKVFWRCNHRKISGCRATAITIKGDIFKLNGTHICGVERYE